MRLDALKFSKSLAGYPVMRRSFIILSMAGSLLFGCSKSEPAGQSKSSGSSGNPITAPVDYLGAAAQGQKKAMKTLDEAGLNQTIQMFYAAEGRYPKDLNELVKPDYLSSLPNPPPGMKFDYSPASGQVKVVPK